MMIQINNNKRRLPLTPTPHQSTVLVLFYNFKVLLKLFLN